MPRGRRATIRSIAAAVLCLVSAQQCPAQIHAPEPIEAPLPESWRAPFARFLGELGTAKVDELLDATKTKAIHPADALVLRIEHASACTKDGICITIIAKLKEGTIDSMAMFYAGKWMTHGDVNPNFLDTSVPPPVLFFTSRTPTAESRSVAMISTPKGWILAGGSN